MASGVGQGVPFGDASERDDNRDRRSTGRQGSGRPLVSTTRTLVSLACVAIVGTACGGSDTTAEAGDAPTRAETPSAGATSTLEGDTEGTDTGEARIAITVGTSPALTNTSLYLARDDGHFAAAGLDATIELTQSGAQAVPLLLNGETQFTAADPVAAMIAMGEGVPLAFVVPANMVPADPAADSTGLVVQGQGPIASVADLTNRTVAVNALNSSSHLAALRTIDKLGGDSSTVNFVEIPFPEMVGAVGQGRVDAAVVNEPFVTAGRGAGLRSIAAPAAEALGGLPLVMYVAASTPSGPSPEVIDAFVEAMTAANAYLGENPAQIRTIGATSTQTPQDLLERVALPVFSGVLPGPDDMSGYVDLMIEYGFVSEDFTLPPTAFASGAS